MNLEKMDLEKQTLVRVKRKRNDDPFESLWLEVTPRPTKRQEAAFSNLSLNEATPESQGDKGTAAKLLYRRVETLTPSGVRALNIPDFLQRIKETKHVEEKRRHSTNAEDKEEQQLEITTVPREESSGTASFQQIWQSRKRSKSSGADPMQDFFLMYDVVRIDEEQVAAKTERRRQAKREAEAELRQGQLLCNYLPMLREFAPSAATEIEAEVAAPAKTSSDPSDYVYDVYVLNEDSVDSEMRDASRPLIRIMDDEDWEGGEAVDSDFDSDDSNCEGNPQNDYPDEEDDSSHEISPYGSDNEEYDTALTDDEEDFRRWR